MRQGLAILSTLGASAFTLIGGLAATAVLARLLGPAELGRYSVLVAAAAVLAAILEPFGWRYRYLVELPRAPHEAPHALAVSIAWPVVVVVALGGTVLAFPDGFDRFVTIVADTPRATATVLWWGLPLAVGANAMFVHAGNVRMGLRQFSVYNQGRLLLSALLLASACILFTLRFDQMEDALVGWTIAHFATALFVLVSIRPRTPRLARLGGGGTGFRAYLFGLMALASNRVSVAMLLMRSNAGEAGLFAAALAVADLLQRIPTVIGTVSQPFLSSADSGSQGRTLRASRIAFAVLLAMAVLSALLIPLYVSVGLGSGFQRTSRVLWLLLPSAIATGMMAIHGGFLAAHGYPPVLHLAAAAGATVTLVLTWVLAPSCGAAGAAAAASVGNVIAGLCIAAAVTVRFHWPLARLYRFTLEDLEFVRSQVHLWLRRRPPHDS